jgi:hypothetical protein
MPDKRPKGTHNPSPSSLRRWDNEGGAPVGGRAKRPRDPAQLAKLMIDIASGEVEDRPPTPEEQGKDPAAVALGRKGGKARAAGMSAKKRKRIAKQAAKARWAER